MSLKDQILSNIKSNGFPDKKVSLSLEKMYEVADNKGENLNTILEELKSMGVDHEKTPDKIIFQNGLPNRAPAGLEKAQQKMKDMDPKEMKKLQDQVANMSEEEKEKLMEQAKAMGLF
jgi:ATP-dependent DNA ligase